MNTHHRLASTGTEPTASTGTELASGTGPRLGSPRLVPVATDWDRDQASTPATAALNSARDGARAVRPEEAVPARRVLFTPASSIRLRPTYWLWDDRIPLGTLVLGPGREGIGKSLFCAWLTAQVTRGTLPGVHHGTPRTVVYAATEDSWERTIAGRLIAADADLDKVYRVEVASPTGTSLPLSLPRDCESMATEITRAGVGLVVLDPLISAVDSRIDVNGEGLREALEPLAKLADDTECSIFGLAHFNKGTGTDVLSRITGSRAFSAVARAVIAFARDTITADGSCVLSQAKNNLGPLDLPSLRYVVESVTLPTDDGPGHWGRLRFLGETDTHVNELLEHTPARAEPSGNEEIDAWLCDYLTGCGGRAASVEVIAAGAGEDYSEAKLKRAKKRVGVASEKDGTTGVWSWVLPAHPATDQGSGQGDRQGSTVRAP